MGFFDRFRKKKEEVPGAAELGIQIDPNASKEFKEEMKRKIEEHNEEARQIIEYHENVQKELKAFEDNVNSFIAWINKTPSIKELIENFIEELKELGFGEGKIKEFEKRAEEIIREKQNDISRGSEASKESAIKAAIKREKGAMVEALKRSKGTTEMRIDNIRNSNLSEEEKKEKIEYINFCFQVTALGNITDISKYIEETKNELLQSGNYSKEKIEGFISEVRKNVEKKLNQKENDTAANIKYNNENIAKIICDIKDKTNEFKEKEKSNQLDYERKIEEIRNIELGSYTEKFRQIFDKKFNNNYEEEYKNRKIELEKNRHDFLEGNANKKELIDSYLRYAELYGCFDSAKEEIRARLEGVEGNNKKDINFKMNDITNGFIKRKSNDLQKYLLHANLLKEVKYNLKYGKSTLEFIRELLSKTSEEVEELLDNADKKVKEEFDKEHENLSPTQRLNKYGIPLPYKNRLDIHAPESYSEDDEARRKQQLEMMLSEEKMNMLNARRVLRR